VIKILIINPFGIGDVLFTTPVIRAIKNTWPDASISYWCNERVREIFENNPDIDKVFALSRGDLKRVFSQSKINGIKKLLSLFFKIKKGKFDIALDYSLDHRYGLIAKLAGIKRRIGFNYKFRGRFLTERIDLDKYSGKHIVEWYLSLLKFLEIKPKESHLEIFVPKKDKEAALRLLSEAGISYNNLIIGIAPGAGASWGKDAAFKHWPAENFACLIDLLHDKLGAKVVVLGDFLEKHIAETIRKSAKNKFIDLIGVTDLGSLIAVIGNLRLLIANDGGPMHIAAALGINTVSIFGPVDEVVYGPYPASDKHIVIKSSVSCRPCYQNFKLPICQKNKECIKSITVEEVFDAARRLI
jgi:lipopolysaccharide heptosyltransferase II